jgi:hypothetical protein
MSTRRPVSTNGVTYALNPSRNASQRLSGEISNSVASSER